MDATVLGAIIGGGATLAAAMIAAWSSVRGRRESRQQLADLITWTHIHQEQDNDVRKQLGIPAAAYPDLAAWRNASAVPAR